MQRQLGLLLLVGALLVAGLAAQEEEYVMVRLIFEGNVQFTTGTRQTVPVLHVSSLHCY